MHIFIPIYHTHITEHTEVDNCRTAGNTYNKHQGSYSEEKICTNYHQSFHWVHVLVRFYSWSELAKASSTLIQTHEVWPSQADWYVVVWTENEGVTYRIHKYLCLFVQFTFVMLPKMNLTLYNLQITFLHRCQQMHCGPTWERLHERDQTWNGDLVSPVKVARYFANIMIM